MEIIDLVKGKGHVITGEGVVGSACEAWLRQVAPDGDVSCSSRCLQEGGGCQVAERLGNQAGNQNVAGSIPGRAKCGCVFGQGTFTSSLPRGMSLYLQ